MTNDMTKGSPAGLILFFAIQVFLGNVFQQFYNLVDVVVAGRYLGVGALAAIGSTSSLVFLVMGWLNGLTSGFAIMVAQSFGAKNEKALRHYVAMSIGLCVAFVVVMTAALSVLNRPILERMHSPDDIIDQTTRYLSIIYAGLFVTCAYNAFAAVLRSLGDSRSPLYFLILSAVINTALDVVFVTTLGMDVEGCAWATVIAQGISALLCLVYIMKKFAILKLHAEDFWWDAKAIRQLLTLGIPMALQFSITAIGTIIVQSAVNTFGTNHVAGFAAAGKIENMICSVFVAFGAAVATYTGQNWGARETARIRRGVRTTQAMILAAAVLLYFLVRFFADPLILVFIERTQEEAVTAARTYFHTVSWAYPFLGSIFLYRNTLQGLGYGFMPMMGGVFELAARAAVVRIVATLGLGFMETCASDPAAWIAALVPIVPYYLYVRKKKLLA